MLDPCECSAFIKEDHPDYSFYSKIYPGAEVPLVSPVPHAGKFDGFTYPFYEIDRRRITVRQLEQAAEYMAQKFHMTKEEILREITDPKNRLPLRDHFLIVHICVKHTRLMY